MSFADMTKAQQAELLKDFSEGKTTICEAGHVDGLDRIIAELRAEGESLAHEIINSQRALAVCMAENERLRNEVFTLKAQGTNYGKGWGE